jgi:ABC-type branched-subunit amino acid transport system substrate-binding protein
LEIVTKVLLNGKTANINQEIREGDRLVIEEINTIKDLIKYAKLI